MNDVPPILSWALGGGAVTVLSLLGGGYMSLRKQIQTERESAAKKAQDAQDERDRQTVKDNESRQAAVNLFETNLMREIDRLSKALDNCNAQHKQEIELRIQLVGEISYLKGQLNTLPKLPVSVSGQVSVATEMAKSS